MAKTQESGEVVIQEVQRGRIECCIIGTTPFIANRMSQKVLHTLLAPTGKKNAAEKASTMKHDPIKEFRDSPYRIDDKKASTLLGILPTSFKGAMGTAALRSPGVSKTAIGQLVYVEGEMLGLYGVPKVFMSVTRSADINKTPDVRTRALLPEWACRIAIEYTKPILREQAIVTLLSTAGIVSGVGDWRQEKGSGSYGCFRLCSADDKDFLRILKTQGRAVQQAALDKPEAYNDETSEMLAWFNVEIKRRGFRVAGNEMSQAAD